MRSLLLDARTPVLAVGVWLVWVGGCSSSSHPAGLGNCTGAGCGQPAGAGNTPANDAAPDGTTADAGDAEAATAVQSTDIPSGEIVLLSDKHFENPTEFLGSGSVHVPTPKGDVEVPFNADGGQGFEAENVVDGRGWYSVYPDDLTADGGLGAGVYVSWDYLDLDSMTADDFEVPVLDRLNIQRILAELAQPMSAAANAAQVIVVFERKGNRVPLVSLTQYPPCESVLYDTSIGYSKSSPATANAGVAFLVNAVGTGYITWKEEGGASGSVNPIYFPDQATFMRIELP